MKKFWILLIFAFTQCFAQQNYRLIDVNGTSEIIAQADFIDFTINIRNVAETLEESRKVNMKASDELVNILSDFKISKADWELSPIRFGKEYSYSREERKQIGYFSQVSINVKLHSLNDYYSFISALSKNKFYEIVRSDYGVSDLLKYHREATIKAVQAAKEKAEYLAQTMGVKLGKIIEINELNRAEAYPNPFNSVTKMGGGEEMTSGKISVSRSVNLKIEITDLN